VSNKRSKSTGGDENKMIEIQLTKDIINKCESRANEIGNLNNSITSGEGNLAGVIGEYLVHKHLEGSKWENQYGYDLKYKNKTIDVKTKRSKYKPLEFYDVAIAETSLHQECDEYIFVTILNDMSKAWIVGGMEKEKYFNSARKMIKGQVDPSNNFKVKSNCYNMKIEKLNQINSEETV